MVDDVSKLTLLGSQKTEYKYDSPCSQMFETFPNQQPERNYEVELIFPEFSSLCPKTGQPDFATIEIRYIPDQLIVESKSIKMYFFAWRDQGSFMETITNKVLSDFVNACQPRWCEVRGLFAPRGGLRINVTATHGVRL